MEVPSLKLFKSTFGAQSYGATSFYLLGEPRINFVFLYSKML